MVDHVLTDQELALVLEILEGESKRLLVETRRADARAMRHDLQNRQRAVDRLIERFHEIQAGDLKT
jgi:hypothetical protein